jgi:translocation and assembly module TamB
VGKIANAISAAILVGVIAIVLLLRSVWFQQFVRDTMIAAVEGATGGRVEAQSFFFDWTRLHATFTGFTLHGTEPPSAAPLLRARRIDIWLRLFVGFHLINIADLEIDRPQANILIAADGSTNVPKPRHPSSATPLENVVDLAAGHFALTDGSVTVNSRKQPLYLRGDRLHVQIRFDTRKETYRGEISLAPVYAVTGRNRPMRFQLTLPVSVDRNAITFRNARIATAGSQLEIDGSVSNLRDPKVSARVRGHVALADLASLTDLRITPGARGGPSALAVDIDATASDSTIDVARSRIALGASSLQASGRLRDPAGKGRLEFRSQLALGELSRLFSLPVRADGTARLEGTATLDRRRNYDVQGQLEASGVSLRQASRRISNLTLTSALRLTPARLDLTGLRLDADGAAIDGNARLEHFAQYGFEGNLRRLDLRTLARQLGWPNIGYDGVASGPLSASGDLHVAGMQSIAARAKLSISPGRRGIPLAGRLNASYHGDRDIVQLTDSYLALPHSRLTLDGSLDRRLNVALTSSDLRDFNPLIRSPLPVSLSGPATFRGMLTGRLSSPLISGHVAAGRFSVQGRPFEDLAADVALNESRAAITAGSLRHGPMQATLSATVGLRHWYPAPDRPLSAQASIHKGDLADLIALAGVAPEGDSGALNLDLNVAGTVGNPRGSASLAVAHGSLRGEPFDTLEAQVALDDQLVTVNSARVTAGPSHAELTAEWRHPPDRFDRGQLQARLRAEAPDLAQFRTVQRWRPHTAGGVRLDAELAGELRDSPTHGPGEPEFVLTRLAADASGRGVRFDGQNYGGFTASARTNGQTLTYRADSDFAGSQIHLAGNTQLAPGYATTADASITNLPIQRILSLVPGGMDASGILTAKAHFTGTMDRPEGSLDVAVDRGVLYGEPVDLVRARVNSLAGEIDVPQLELRAGPSAIRLTARYDHPGGALMPGSLKFRVQEGHIDLARVQVLQKLRPGLAGTVQVSGGGAADVSGAAPYVQARDVNLDLAAKGISAGGKSLGDLTLNTKSSDGDANFTFDSNFAGASIQGRGRARLGDGYPLDALVSFRGLDWKRLEPLVDGAVANSDGLDAEADGQFTVKGPALRPAEWSGRADLSRLQVTAMAGPPAQTVALVNQGPVALVIDRGTLRIGTLHLAGPQTDLRATGELALGTGALQGTVTGRADLGLLQRLQRDVISSGEIAIDATVAGTLDKPLIGGKVELHRAAINLPDLPTGISNASGTIQFNGTSASFSNITAESGGGRITLSGFLRYTDSLRFAVHAAATNVRLRLQPGVSATANADLRINGRLAASIASGTITIDQVTYTPQSDFAAILTRAAPPVQTRPGASPLLDNMRLDIQVRTSPAMEVQTSLAENLQVDANLHLQGTGAQPGLLGRITITEGSLLFFSSRYNVNTGIISFYNPTRIEPIVDLSLQTQARGVDVTLRVTGPMDNLKLSYTSEPPLQFQELVGLLAAGRIPTSDPTLLANQPNQPAQSFEGMGESVLLSKALADPVANRLQRVFGVSQLRIDPSFISGSDLPQAQVTLQQRVTSSLTLTYITALDNSNTKVVRGEWMLSPQWSAIATRDVYGIFSIKLLYKMQLR